MSRIGGAAVAVALGLGSVLSTSTLASATVVCVPSDGVAAYDEIVIDIEAYDETVVDSAAHWQRYATKGSWKEDFAPDFPGDIWVANVEGDPHGKGVAGAYSVSNENSGNTDWFYLEWVEETSHVVHHDEVSHIVHHEAVPPVVCEPEPIVPTECEVPTVLATATNLNSQGWTLVNGEWVEGGIEFTSSNWSDAYAHLTVSFPLSHAATLDFDGDTTGGLFAIILQTAAGNVHYEPSYSDPLWTNAAGILPTNVGGQGGPFSGTLYDLQSDPTVTGVYAYFTSGNPEATTGVLHSVSAFCYEQPFDKVDEIVVVPEQPDDLIIPGDWVDGEYGCDDTTVAQTRTVTTKEYILVENEWVLEAEADWQVETEDGEPRLLTPEEIAAKDLEEDCVVVVPDPPKQDIGKALAHTPGGENASSFLTWAGLTSLLGVVLIAGSALARRKA